MTGRYQTAGCAMQALGVAVDIGPEGVARCIEECGVGFMFAPRWGQASLIFLLRFTNSIWRATLLRESLGSAYRSAAWVSEPKTAWLWEGEVCGALSSARVCTAPFP